MKVREIPRILREDGWFLVASRGSHATQAACLAAGRLQQGFLDGLLSEDLAPGTLKSILKQADIK